MRRQIFLAFVAISAIAVAMEGLRLGAQSVEPKPLDDPEAYAVYASLVPRYRVNRGTQTRRLVFQKETRLNQGCVPTGQPLQTDWKPVVDSFWMANASAHLLREGFPLGIPYVVVPSVEISSLFAVMDHEGWNRFYARYPDSGGYMAVSAVGFDASKRRAMVHMSTSCHFLCGRGAYHFLEKTDLGWIDTKIPGVSTCTTQS